MLSQHDLHLERPQLSGGGGATIATPLKFFWSFTWHSFYFNQQFWQNYIIILTRSHEFAISIFFILWAMTFGICIDYQSVASIGIPTVLYLKRTLELSISTLILMFVACLIELELLLCKFIVYLWYTFSITLWHFAIMCHIILLRAIASTLLINKWSPLAAKVFVFLQQRIIKWVVSFDTCTFFLVVCLTLLGQ